MGTSTDATITRFTAIEKHLLSNHYIPNSVPGVLHILFLIPIAALWGGYYFAQFRVEETKAKRVGGLVNMTQPVSSRARKESKMFTLGLSFSHCSFHRPYLSILFFLRFYLFTFREGGREREREGEKHQCARDTFIGCFLNAPIWGCGP